MKRNIFTVLALTALILAALPTGIALAVDDLVGPITSNVAVAPNPATINTSVTVTATVDDSTTGAAVIQSAEYNVNGGDWTAMSAADGAFDAAAENVTATFALTLAGDNAVCVRGTDALNNVGAETCTTVAGQYLYTFEGFRPPIKMGVENKANAPRAIPVKWKLTFSADGKPVSDPASFVAAWSYQVDCVTLVGDPATAVEAKTPGKSGFRYQNKGNWMFNWKTDKAYAGTCRLFYVEFSDGQLSPTVLFHFR